MLNNATVKTALARLHEATVENPGVQEAAAFYQRLIPAINDLAKEVPGLAIDQRAMEQKFADGVPLLVDELLEFDAAQSSRILEAIITVVMEADDGNGEAKMKANHILEAIRTGALDPLHLLSLVNNGDAGLIETAASRLGLDAQMLLLLGQNTLKVFLRAWREKLETHVDLESWQRGICPFCGVVPTLAEIRGVEASRYLRCLRCGAGWPYPNLRCAFCGNNDHRTLTVLLVNSQPCKHYVHACDRCRHYIKTIISFEPLSTELLMVEDLATLQLDCLAAEREYVK